MGGGSITGNSLKQSEIIQFRRMASLSNDIILKIHNHFSKFSVLKRDDGLIDYEEFCTLINRKDNLLISKLFNCMDLNKDKKINFREFLTFISKFISGTKEEQTRITYKIFIDEEKNLITFESLFKIMKEIFQNIKDLEDFFDDYSLTNLIKETFQIVQSQEMNYDEYKLIIEKNPSILYWFKINVNNL